MDYVNTLLAYGVSPAGAQQDVWGQPISNPVDRDRIDRAKKSLAIQQAPTSPRLTPGPALKRYTNAHRSALEQRANEACSALRQEIYSLEVQARSYEHSRDVARGQLHHLETHRPVAGSDPGLLRNWEDRCRQLRLDISRYDSARRSAYHSANYAKERYNKDCGGSLLLTPSQEIAFG